MEEEAFIWVKKNIDSIINLFANDKIYKSEVGPVTVFMAGSPGAGKTEIARSLIERFENKPVHIDADKIREICPGYNGKNSSLFQKASNKGVNILYDYCLRYDISLVLDGTFAYDGSIKNVKRSLDKKRKIEIYFVYHDPKEAWQITKVRELEEGRYVPKNVFIDTYLRSQENIKSVKKKYGEDITLNLIIRDISGLEILKLNIKSIDPFIKKVYSETELR